MSRVPKETVLNKELRRKSTMDKRTCYDKLVRDKISEHLCRKKLKHKVSLTKDHFEYQERLETKLLEEVKEFLDEPCNEEAADVLEVFEALLKAHGIALSNVIDARFKKAESKGRFNDGVVLEWVER